MCGIAGYASRDPLNPDAVRHVRALSEKLVHRGPDSSGEWISSHVIFAHRRLAILDLTSTGAQPIHSRSGRWTLVFNGEIVNFLELRQEIGGDWRGKGDAEALVEALDRWGVSALPRLAGMFAFAAWDNVERRLLLARDPIGLKPLFYCQEPDGSLVFSSTAASLASQKKFDVRRDMLACVLALGYPPVGETLFAGIKELPPAHYAVWDGKTAPYFHKERYWSLPRFSPTRALTVNRIDEEFDRLFHLVLRQWARSDVPVSVLLSSGVDSTAIAAGLAEIGGEISALTVKMPHADLDESGAANRMARQLSLPSRTINLEEIDLLHLVDQIAYHSDLPAIDSSEVGTWLLCKHAAAQGKVVFTGDGGDEIFAGYPTHKANALIAGPFGSLFRAVSRVVSRHIEGAPYGDGPPGWRHKSARFLRYAHHGLPESVFRWRTLVDSSLFSTLFQETLPDPWPVFCAQGHAELPALERALALETECILPQGAIVRVDRMSMAHGLEARPPFLDHRMVEFASRLSFKDKCSWREGGKRPICRWLKRKLPHWRRPPKKGFNHPVQDWFQGPLGERLLDEASENNPLRISPAGVRKILTMHRRRKIDFSFELWSLFFLLSWARINRVSAIS